MKLPNLRAIFADRRVQFALVVLLMLIATLALIASRYGESGIEHVEGQRWVKSDGEHCAIVLPDGWGWRAASWTAVSPGGTILGFSEQLFGRPEYPEWEEVSEAMIERNREREGTTVDAHDDSVRVNYGPTGGLSVLQRFDRVGCLLTFSGAGGVREQEFAVWEEIVASLKRTSPTDNPQEVPPWKPGQSTVEETN